MRLCDYVGLVKQPKHPSDVLAGGAAGEFWRYLPSSVFIMLPCWFRTAVYTVYVGYIVYV